MLLLPAAASLLAAASLAFSWNMSLSGQPLSDANSVLVHPAYITSSLTRAALEGRAPVDATTRAELLAALRQAPLEDEPFTLAAYEQFAERRVAAAQDLLEIARKRNPRSRQTRLLAVDVNLAANSIAAAVSELETLRRLMPAQSAVFDETLVLLADYPDTRMTALRAVKEQPTKEMILVGLARNGAGSPALVEAMQAMALEGRLTADSGTASAVTQPLVTAGNYAAAFEVWSRLTGSKANASGVRDPRFKQDLPPPFGWALTSGGDGSVASDARGLAGQIYGRRNANLARQLLVLPSGSYRLELEVTEPTELLEVALRCLPDQELARQRLGGAGTLGVAFTVPDGCKAQWLELNARASDPPRSASFRIRSIALTGSRQ
ncbi:MAG: hypothetical protein O9293_14195 [Porphyrobacter sp.]|nr:hypothetical protein [Porphyrobacter sp.]